VKKREVAVGRAKAALRAEVDEGLAMAARFVLPILNLCSDSNDGERTRKRRRRRRSKEGRRL
jgi:hypothetical protein